MATAELNPPAGVRRDPFPRPWTPAEFERACGLGVFAGRAVELIDSQIVERIGGDLRPFVFTRKEYYALGDGQFFRDQRVQLIAGEILQMSRMNPPHAVAIQLATKALERVFGDGFNVRGVQLPVVLGPTSEPEPDVAVVRGSPRDYGDDHPTTALLVVELSDTTFDYDAFEKANLYASAGITDYWVIDITRHRLIVMRNPQANAGEVHAHRYDSLLAFEEDKFVSPLAAPDARIRVADLLP
ncbi:MAG TPA: Uma2 family endonuclease [Gemmataceae bacterium]|nr:Uma2 family endonuclease [Gemmataceae bacterium]